MFYPRDSAWAAVIKTSSKINLDIVDQRCLDKFSSLKNQNFDWKKLLIYHSPLSTRYLTKSNNFIEYFTTCFFKQFILKQMFDREEKRGFEEQTRSCSRIFGKLFFHSVSKLNLVALNVSACCSTLSFTIFQKQSLTAKLKFRVVVCVALNTPSL